MPARIALYRDFEHRVGEARGRSSSCLPTALASWDVEALLGRFVDAAWAYRFGPPAQDLIVASLQQDADDGHRQRARGQGSGLLSQSVRFPAGRPLATESVARLGLTASASELAGGAVLLSVKTERFAYGVRLHVAGFRPTDDAFSVQPQGERTVLMLPRQAGAVYAGGWLTALNLDGRLRLSSEQHGDSSGAPVRSRVALRTSVEDRFA